MEYLEVVPLVYRASLGTRRWTTADEGTDGDAEAGTDGDKIEKVPLPPLGTPLLGIEMW